METKSLNQVEILIDWENIRRRLADNYAEAITIEQVMSAFEKVAKEIGRIQIATFYGDFTLRRDEARSIESKPLFKVRNVLRTVTQRDRVDSVIIADIMEMLTIQTEHSNIILGSGDSTYCDVIRRAIQKGLDTRICAVGVDVSAELSSLAPVYPIERYLNVQLTRRTRHVLQDTLPTLSSKDLARWMKLVKLLQSLETTLPFVGSAYFQNTIMASYFIGGQSRDDRFAYMETAREMGVIILYDIDNPTRPGYKMNAVKLNRENPVVKEILSIK